MEIKFYKMSEEAMLKKMAEDSSEEDSDDSETE